MARAVERGGSPAIGGATLDFERQLWAMADGLRGHLDEATDLVNERAELLGTEWAA